MAANTNSDITIIGAGIIGLALAAKLVSRGYSTTIVDPEVPGSGCSFGNAGIISDWGIYPPAAMAGLRKLPKMLLDPYGPLVVRPTHLHRFIGWGLKAALANSPKRLAHIVAAQAALTRIAMDCYRPLLQECHASDLIDSKGALIVCRTHEALDHRAKRIPAWRENGISVEKINSHEIHALEPALAKDLVGGLFFPNAARCLDPFELSRRIVAATAAKGVMFYRDRVRDLKDVQGEWNVGLQSGASIVAKRVIVAAGFWSAELLRPLGYKVNIEAERGYHLMLPNPGILLNRPVSMAEANFAATPMASGLRFAGTAEFAGPDAPADNRRATMMYGLAKPFLPGVCDVGAIPWMGCRPSLPDMLPAIGRASRHQNLYYCFGHQHMGLTQAAASAELIAAIMHNEPTPVDPLPYSLDRSLI